LLLAHLTASGEAATCPCVSAEKTWRVSGGSLPHLSQSWGAFAEKLACYPQSATKRCNWMKFSAAMDLFGVLRFALREGRRRGKIATEEDGPMVRRLRRYREECRRHFGHQQEIRQFATAITVGKPYRGRIGQVVSGLQQSPRFSILTAAIQGSTIANQPDGSRGHDDPTKLVTKSLMFFPEDKPNFREVRRNMRGGSKCMSR
jgi:hypothetical protein